MVIYATSSPVFRSYLRPECGGVDVALPATLRISVVEIPGPARRLSDWREVAALAPPGGSRRTTVRPASFFFFKKGKRARAP